MPNYPQASQSPGGDLHPEDRLVDAAGRARHHLLAKPCLGDFARVPPEALVDFFVRFLTDPGDLVLDPFAGSNTTGAVAERLNRKWLALERDPEYARASRARFAPAA